MTKKFPFESIQTLVQSKLATYDFSFTLKHDQTLVTELDLFVSSEVKKRLPPTNNWTFFCEENHDQLTFPAYILDPIDGTRELIKGRGECAVSLAIMHSPDLADLSHEAYIFNPFTGFLASTEQSVLVSKSLNPLKHDLYGMVSRTDNLAMPKNPHLHLIPRGSIAFKLALLASGACDFVFSATPKNIWDIAAGTILCQRQGIFLFQGEEQVMTLNDKFIEGPLLWCRPEYVQCLKNEWLNR